MKLIVLNRDGVINHDSKDYIKSEDEWQAIDGSLEAIAKLTQNEYQVVVVSEQEGIGRGIFTIEDLNRIHQKMIQQLAQIGGRISAVFSPLKVKKAKRPSLNYFIKLRNA